MDPQPENLHMPWVRPKKDKKKKKKKREREREMKEIPPLDGQKGKNISEGTELIVVTIFAHSTIASTLGIYILILQSGMDFPHHKKDPRDPCPR